MEVEGIPCANTMCQGPEVVKRGMLSDGGHSAGDSAFRGWNAACEQGKQWEVRVFCKGVLVGSVCWEVH